MTATIWLLLLHGLSALALLGIITHQSVACLTRLTRPAKGFVSHYAATTPQRFVNAAIWSYLIVFVLGCIIYPAYRLDVRIALSEMQLPWAIGMFELKEHWAALGLAMLPLYKHCWSNQHVDGWSRSGITTLLAVIVWFNLIVGHVLNNFRGL